jgi:hypothetical protein
LAALVSGRRRPCWNSTEPNHDLHEPTVVCQSPPNSRAPGASRRFADAGTLEDLAARKADRLRAGAEPDEPFLASLIPGRAVKPFSRHTLRKRFRTACKVLGAARLEALTIHHGRHTLISHALAGGRTLAEVRDAARHGNVSIASGNLHVAVDEDAAVGRLFRFVKRPISFADGRLIAEALKVFPHGHAVTDSPYLLVGNYAPHSIWTERSMQRRALPLPAALQPLAAITTTIFSAMTRDKSSGFARKIGAGGAPN